MVKRHFSWPHCYTCRAHSQKDFCITQIQSHWGSTAHGETVGNNQADGASRVVTPKKIWMWICMDPKDLNQVIKWEYYPSLKGKVAPRMPNAKYFPLLDANQGFWQIKLDNESSKLLIPPVEIPAFTVWDLFSARGVSEGLTISLRLQRWETPPVVLQLH